jgi:hypothetical protein
VWAVGVVLAGAVLIFMLIRNRSKNADTSSTAEPPADAGLYYEPGADGVVGLPPGAIGDYLNQDPTNPAYPTGLTPQGIPGPVTNVQWSRLVFDLLVSRGDDPSLVERALSKYLRGQALTAEEQGVINLAHQLMGAPPEGLILIPNTPPIVPNPPGNPGPLPPGHGSPVPTKQRRFVIVARWQPAPRTPWNSTLSGIASHYGVALSQIERINGFKPYGSRNPNMIFTGEKIWIDP